MRNILLLGGTSEASQLAKRLAAVCDCSTTLSLAGRTRAPAAQAIPTRIGGFGGIEGLRHWLQEHRTQCVIDATHPFAAQMSAHAAAACDAENVFRIRVTRPPWRPQSGDRWIDVPDGDAAARALGLAPRRVFLPMGRLSLAPFAAAPWHFYVVRSIDAPENLSFLPQHRSIIARPPFARDDETVLLRDERIDMMVTKNSGGDATRAKLDAARDLSLPVVMIERPAAPAGPLFHDIDEVLSLLKNR